jgi:ABC transport system ATP-binding/permease protein
MHEDPQALTGADRLSRMSRPLPPTITVFSLGWQRTFAPGSDVMIGRDVRADVRLVHPAVSRDHVTLRHLDGGWVAIDNESLNGIFVGNRRVRSVDIHGGETLHIGNPDGPRLTFELGRSGGAPDDRPTMRMTRGADLGTAVSTIGNAPDNDIVVPDVLASRHHAVLVPTPQGVRIQDVGSTNGTFVNGQRIKDAFLRDGDVVTIGNVDLVVADGTLVRRTEPAANVGGLEVRDVSFTVDGTRTLLDRISFSAKPGTLTAVIGPSGAGKSTLSKVIVGGTSPNSGTVSFEGHDLHTGYASLRSRIGMVPQDDVVHRQLTISRALGYAAELRMPDSTKQDRQRVIAQVLEELELTPHAETRIDKLSGGQRKRVSVALELLTGPSLLVLDEPTTGLDPALDQQVMTMLRQLADAGRVVVVVTHSLAYLDVCDQVLLLAPGGKTAFCGPPSRIGPTMGTTDWADIFTEIDADPEAAQRRFLERAGRPAEPPVQAMAEKPSDLGKPVHTGPWRQFSPIARRQVRLILADRGYCLFLALLPFIVGLLPLAVAGDVGFGRPSPDSGAPFEPKQIVVLLNLGAIFMGTALTIRELVGERVIFRREQAAGLSTSAYLLAKVGVFGAAAVVQSAILVLLVTVGKGAAPGASALGSPTLELFIDTAATCVAAAVLGLAVSTLAQNSNQVVLLVAATLTTQLVLAGGFIPVTDRALLDPISWLTPSRWGLAATASTTDLSNLVMGVPKDSHWEHTASAWWFDLGMLVVLSVFYAGFVRWRIRLKSQRG